MRTIGLIGGMSWESSAEYYRLINEDVRARLGGQHNARSLMVTVDFAEIEAMQRADDWDLAGNVLADAAGVLQRGGADLIGLCTNTMHLVADRIEAAVDVPFIHLVDATAHRIETAGLKRVGLLATRFTMEMGFYAERMARHGIEVLVPPEADRTVVHETIYRELTLGKVEHASREEYRRIMTRSRTATARASSTAAPRSRCSWTSPTVPSPCSTRRASTPNAWSTSRWRERSVGDADLEADGSISGLRQEGLFGLCDVAEVGGRFQMGEAGVFEDAVRRSAGHQGVEIGLAEDREDRFPGALLSRFRLAFASSRETLLGLAARFGRALDVGRVGLRDLHPAVLHDADGVRALAGQQDRDAAWFECVIAQVLGGLDRVLVQQPCRREAVGQCPSDTGRRSFVRFDRPGVALGVVVRYAAVARREVRHPLWEPFGFDLDDPAAA
jgi:aspartate racemase